MTAEQIEERKAWAGGVCLLCGVVAVALVLVACLLCAGCLTRGKSYVRVTAPDGTVREGWTSIVGTGDKAAEIAAEGLFADGTEADFGTGIQTAKAKQQSSGVDGTLSGLGQLLTGVGNLAAAINAGKSPGAADSVVEVDGGYGASVAYSTEGYSGVPGPGGEGVYGRPSCSRCQAYKRAHPGVEIIDIDHAGNRADMWAALKLRGHPGGSLSLPVMITEDSYTEKAK